MSQREIFPPIIGRHGRRLAETDSFPSGQWGDETDFIVLNHSESIQNSEINFSLVDSIFVRPSGEGRDQTVGSIFYLDFVGSIIDYIEGDQIYW